MRLRITTRAESSVLVVSVAGSLRGSAREELAAVCGSASGSVRLDLAGLRSVDDRSLQTLRALAKRGVELSHVPAFVDLLLKGAKSP